MVRKNLAILASLGFLVIGCGPKAQVAEPTDEETQKQLEAEAIDESALNFDAGTDKENMVHIIREGDGTVIEFWVNPYKDEVEIDYTFSPQAYPLSRFTPSTATEFPSRPSGVGAYGIDNMQEFLNSYEEAQRLFYSNNYPGALKAVHNALRIMPTAVQGFKLKGSILYKMKDKQGALKAWEAASQLDPKAEDVRKSIKSLKRSRK
ncbi:MAG: hypothetical protein OIF32_08825 [Campylobacterales bacterium]|nr:hypothetical protein [Campylobacterales bacterium]